MGGRQEQGFHDRQGGQADDVKEEMSVFPAELADTRIIREPIGKEQGYWAGAPGVYYAADERVWYLTYRIRRPRGVAPDRGGEARIARSEDLKKFEDIWLVTKDRYNTASIERSAIRKGADGVWRYWTSYVDAADGRWCVAVIKGKNVAKLDAGKVERVFSAGKLGLEGIKDPWIMEHGGIFHMFVSMATATAKTSADSHKTLDIYNTGDCVSATGLATSRDLDKWEWQGVVFAPEGGGWDRYCRRINSVVRHDGKFVAFYDGSASAAENYEERTGLAISDDLKTWRTLTPHEPALMSPNGSGSLRYIDAQETGRGLAVFYEFAREDGAHDMRLARLAGNQFMDAIAGGKTRGGLRDAS